MKLKSNIRRAQQTFIWEQLDSCLIRLYYSRVLCKSFVCWNMSVLILIPSFSSKIMNHALFHSWNKYVILLSFLLCVIMMVFTFNSNSSCFWQHVVWCMDQRQTFIQLNVTVVRLFIKNWFLFMLLILTWCVYILNSYSWN